MHIHPSHVGLVKVGLDQVGSNHKCLAKVDPAHVGIVQVGTAQVRIAQIGPAQTGLAQVGFVQAGLVQVSPAQIETLQRSAPTHVREFEATRITSSRVRSAVP